MTVKVQMVNGGSDSVDFVNAAGTTLAQVKGYDDGSSNGHLEFYTTASGTSTEQMRITSAGNVGIGTSSPTSILQVAKNETTSYDGSATDGQLTVGATAFIQQTGGGNNNAISQLVFQPRAGYPYNRIVSSGGSAPYMTFVTNNAERARIDSSGNLLVGTATSGGTGGLSLVPYNSGGSGTLIINKANNAASTSAFVVQNAGTTVGSITYTNSATTYSTSSDYRLKENVQPMTGALSVVAQLKPVTYNWKLDGSDGQGFIAHELQEVIPDAVVGEKDAVDANGSPVYQGIDTSFLVATLTAAIKEQQALIQTLTERITALENKQ